MNAELPIPDLDECVRFAGFWCEATGLLHLTLTAITPDGPTTTATFQRGEAAKLRDWIARVQSNGRNIYFQPNETPADCTKKPAKAEMIAAVCRHADVDPDDDHYPWAEERERFARLADCLTADPDVPPTAIIDSGNGMQPLWAVAREVVTADSVQRIEAENRQVEAALGAFATHDVSRLLRLPGTVNFPTSRKRSLGRGISRARLVHALPRSYRVDEAARLGNHLAQMLAGSPLVRASAAKSEKDRASGGSGAGGAEAPDLLERIEAAPALWPMLARRWAGDWAGLSDSSASGKAMALGSALKRAGFSFEDMCQALHAHRDTARWTPEKGEANGRRELRRIWDKTGGSPQPESDHEAHSAWPEPIAEDAYHGLAGDVVRAIEPHTEADPIAILVQFLVYFGNAVGRGPYYQVEGDRHATNLYAVLVGATAKARKGTSAGRVRQIFDLADSQWAGERIHGGMSSGEGLIWNVRDPTTTRVREGKGAGALYVDQETDPGVADKRLMILEPEFAGALRVMQREGNILSRIVRDAWDRGDLATLTKNSPARATGALVSIAGHITEHELRQSLDRVEMANGFANRLLFACVRRSRVLPHGGNLGEQSIRDLAARTEVALAHARAVCRVEMTAGARADWESVYEPLSEGQPGLLGAIIARAEAQVIRLALLYALMDLKTAIGSEHLRAALAVWEYCEASARHIFGNLLGDPVADEILRALRQAGEAGMTRTEIRDLFGRHRSATLIDQALAYLAQQGKARMTRTDTGGRPAEVWIATAKGR